MLEQVAGRREALCTLLAHVRLLLRVRPLVDAQIGLCRPLVRADLALERLHCGMHGLVARHRAGRLESFTARRAGERTLASVGSEI